MPYIKSLCSIRTIEIPLCGREHLNPCSVFVLEALLVKLTSKQLTTVNEVTEIIALRVFLTSQANPLSQNYQGL